MIWLTWRQFRVQTYVTVGALAVLALFLLYLGNATRDFYETEIVACAGDACRTATDRFWKAFVTPVTLTGTALVAVPGIIGIFWGAPLVARELEERTDRLVWNQSVTRGRWLAVKLGGIALFSMLVTGLFSLMLTWSASRYDQVMGGRFDALTFDARNIVPLGYGLLAFVLGTVVGMVVRRTLPAMAITLAVFAALQILVPGVVRQHLLPPVTATVTLDAAAFGRIDGININGEGMFIGEYSVPDGWALTGTAQVYKADGTPFTLQDARKCIADGDREAAEKCFIAQNLHFSHTYHPGSRYWPFQWIELGLYTALSALLALFGFWWLRRRI